MNNRNQEIGLKKEVLERIIRAFLSDNFEESARLIPFEMRPKGYEVRYRCCVHKERAILRDRAIACLGFSIEEDDEVTNLSNYAKKALEREHLDDNPLTLVETACKGCVPNRICVTDVCQGCVASSCKTACKFGAISIVNGRSKIDPAKCKNCKMCISACPYNAIVKIAVPCEDACPVDAIKKNENGTAKIDYNVCISCGKCMMACPFGAVHEKSQIVDILKNIKGGKKVAAMMAPSIVGQFQGSVYQLKSALKKVGFYDVYEVAEGADITARNEAREFDERMGSGESFMTTSCCAGYGQFIKKHFPEIKKFVSTTKTPMRYIAEKIKAEHPDYVTVFISPCVAKKNEAYENKDVNYVSNFEEIAALLSAKDIKVSECAEEKFEVESSKQGRNFGVMSGVAGAVAKLLGDKKDIIIKPHVINGLNKDSIKLLKKMTKDKKFPDGNLVEVMCCEGGCISGNATMRAPSVAQKAIKTLCDQSKDIEMK
ncbi:MAG: monomeric [FeFe] hydrogenase [Endomicrobium sp.]|jgi:[FeFe] hydrogenase (group B1/B3)|nr:monomeric [FeFe] hydrogenase [Endomicrobium sp.]